jgi:DNA replication protein DnaC
MGETTPKHFSDWRTGVGKSWLAAALAHKACRDGFTAYYARAGQLFLELALAHADGSPALG